LQRVAVIVANVRAERVQRTEPGHRVNILPGTMAGTTPAENILEADDITVTYETTAGPLAAVRHASIKVRSGEVLGIVGESGSGKSTLAQIVMGYRPAGAVTSGSVLFQGISLLELSSSSLRSVWGRKIAMVHQNALATLTPTMMIGDQIAETIRHHRHVSWRDARRAALDALASVNIPSPEKLYRRYPHQLSGGQRQRISIAIALSMRPDLLILDEPTTALDVTTEAVILDLLRELKASTGAAMIYISHNLAVVGQVADRVAVMYAGEIVEVGETSALFAAPSHPYTRALIDCVPGLAAKKRETSLRSIAGDFPSLRDVGTGCVFRSRCERRTQICETSPDWKETSATNAVRCFHDLAAGQSQAAGTGPATLLMPSETVALDVANLSKVFGGAKGMRAGRAANIAVNDASLQAHGAEIVGLVGESGSGKTTFLRCIAGLTQFERGAVSAQGGLIAGNVGRRTTDQLKSIQMVFQDPESTLNPAVTVGENLVRHIRALRRSDAASARAQAIAAIAKVRLNKSYFDRYPAELSGGEKQRVAIARAFAAEPSIILCDEPLSALDVSIQSSIVQLLLDLQMETKASYILVSHDLSIVRYIADRIVVMYLGRIVDEGSTESFDHLPLHPYTEALLSAVPTLGGAEDHRIRLEKQASESDKAIAGCVFAARCPRVIDGLCHDTAPRWQQMDGRRYLCHHTSSALAALQEVGQMNAGDLATPHAGVTHAN
jgi:peptide/nickel transport system ATP-binding protein